MCGIIGYVGEQAAAPLLLEAIRRLEYRGYDSAGMSTLSGSDLFILKDQGKIQEVDAKHNFKSLKGNIGAAHTRWATHGAPSKANAHPHTDCKKQLVVVHNGIIENYVKLKAHLVASHHQFDSETDTEVLAHLIEEEAKTSNSFEDAFVSSLKKLEGSYAIVVFSQADPNTLYVARHFSPLVLGTSPTGHFAASDVPAFLSHTNKAIYMEDGEYAILTRDNFTIKSIAQGKTIRRTPTEINWTPQMAEKGGYDHFTLKEIHEQPEAVSETLRSRPQLKKEAGAFKGLDRLYILACGSSYHAGLIGKYLFERYLGLPTEVIISSEFSESSANLLTSKTGVLAITQSGETADTLKALRLAKANQAKTFALTNVLGSSITRLADHVFYTYAGPEIGVVATKTFLTQLTALYLLVAEVAASQKKKVDYLPDLLKIPKQLQTFLDETDSLQSFIKSRLNCSGFYFLGRGLSYPIALEGALKLKEISYIHAEGFAAGEMKHGPLALLDKSSCVIAIAPDDSTFQKTMANTQEAQARGAEILLLTNATSNLEHATILPLPNINPVLAPLLYVVPLQLLSYYAAVEKGLDPDKPRNLAKSVTVE